MTTALLMTRSRAHFGQAAFAGLCAGLLPDADIWIQSSTDPLLSLEYHRHFTHSLLFSPMIALCSLGSSNFVFRVLNGKSAFKTLVFPVWLAALTHPLCDAWTSYGTHVLWPFSQERTAWDLISVIDPVMTLPLVFLAILSWVKASKKCAVIGFVWVLGYLSLCWMQHLRAEKSLQHWIAQQGWRDVKRSSVKPSFGNIIVWRGMIQRGGEFHALAIRAGWGEPRILKTSSLPMFDDSVIVAGEKTLEPGSVQHQDVKRFMHFSDHWVGFHPHEENVLGDLRYATLPHEVDPLWGIRLNWEQPSQHVEWMTFRSSRQKGLQKLWHLIAGGDVEDVEAPHPLKKK